jgi:TonB-dependent SusC/RagA subfamily outer membrane receptor
MKKLFFFIAFAAALTVQAQIKNDQPLQDSTMTELQLMHINFNGPLYILGDREIAEREVSLIKPNDIESITVLKDSAATSSYGERGRHGVVLIEMKKKKID